MMAEDSEGAGGSALLAKGHVEVTVKASETKVKDIFKDVGDQASKASKDAGDKLNAGIVGGIKQAGKDGASEAKKTGEAIGKATNDGAIAGVTKGNNKFSQGILAGLDASSAGQKGALFGNALAKGITVPLSAAQNAIRQIHQQHLGEVQKLQGSYDELGSRIAKARGELDKMQRQNVAVMNRGANPDLGSVVDAEKASKLQNVWGAEQGIAAMVAQQEAIKTAMTEAHKLAGDVANDGSKIGEKFEGATKKLDEAGEATSRLNIAGGEAAGELSGIGEAILGIVTDPVVAVSAALIAVAGSAAEVVKHLYDIGAESEEMGNALAIQTGASGESLQKLKSVVDQVAPHVALPMEQIGTIVGTVKQQFGDLSETDLASVSKQVGELQNMVGKFDVRSVGMSFKAFGVTDATDQENNLDALYTAYTKTGTGVDEFARDVANAAPTAAQFNLSWGQTAGILTSFSEAGIDSSKALLVLSAAQKSMEKGVEGNKKKGILGIDPIKDPADLNKGLTSVLKNIQDLQKAGDTAGAKDLAEQVFGKSTGRGGGPADNVLAVLKSGKLDADDFAKSLEGANGAIGKMYGQTTTLSSSWQEFKNSITVALEPLGEAVHGFINDGLGGISVWITKHRPEIVQFFGDVAKGVADFTGTMLEGFSAFATIFARVESFLGHDDIAAALNNAAGKADQAAVKMGQFGEKIGLLTDRAKLAVQFTDALGDSVVQLSEDGKSVLIDVKDNTPEVQASLKALGAHLETIKDDPTHLTIVPDTIPAKQKIDAWVAQEKPSVDVGLDPKPPGVGAVTDAITRGLPPGGVGIPIHVLPGGISFPGGFQPNDPNDRSPGSIYRNGVLPHLNQPGVTPTRETGGSIDGVRRHQGDNQLINAKVGEHMWTVDETNAVGGHGAMRHLRSLASAGMLKGYVKGGAIGPLFDHEGPDEYSAAYAHNSPFATAGPYMTQLPPGPEKNFRTWVAANKVPFDPNETISDYDMRGYYRAQLMGTVAPWGGQGSHFPDTFKTPYDTTFSQESEYATKNNPFAWQGDNLVDTRNGQLIFGGGFEGGGGVGDDGPDVSVAEGFVGTPYSKGARDDCSGMVGRIVEGATGEGGGLPTTQNMGAWLAKRGFKPGIGPAGTMSVGWYNHGSGENDGHAAMTLSNGENAESGGSHGNFLIGSGAAGASSSEFDQHMYLPQFYGEGQGGAGGGVAGAVGGSSGGATPAQLNTASAAVTKATNVQGAAQQKLDADKAAGASSDKLAKDQDDLSKATKSLTDKQNHLAELQDKGTKQAENQKDNPLKALGDAGNKFFQDNLPPGFSDPTQWPLVKTAGNVLKDIGGFVKDPTAKALLSAGGDAVGGDFGGAVTGLAGAFTQKPFGQLGLGETPDAPGYNVNPPDAGTPGGSGFDPTALIPNLPNNLDGAPTDGNGGDTNVDASSHIHGDVGTTSAAKDLIKHKDARDARRTRTSLHSKRVLTQQGG